MIYQPPRGEETAEFSPLEAALAEFIQDKFAMGWLMKAERLVHPLDPDLWLIPDTESGEFTMSAKLERQLNHDKSAAWLLELTRARQRRPSER